MIVSNTRITVSPENRHELLQTIGPLVDTIRREKGCLSYRFYLEAEGGDSICLVGEWERELDWKVHLLSDDFAVLFGSLTVLGSVSDIDFKLLSKLGGMEAITNSRKLRLVKAKASKMC